jgi:hypothetical protein
MASLVATETREHGGDPELARPVRNRIVAAVAPGSLAQPMAHRIVGLEFSVSVKTPRATVGGTAEIASVIVWRLAVPLSMAPWNAPST